jgi:hypothetical protein
MRSKKIFMKMHGVRDVVIAMSAAILVACGGGGSDSSQSQQALNTLSSSRYSGISDANQAETKSLQLIETRNLSIFSSDQGSGLLNVRVVIGETLYENSNPGIRLNSVPRFNGICAVSASPCRFDTYAFERLVDGTLVESITADGRYWNFDAAGNAWSGNGSDLRTVPRFATGPCLQAVQTNSLCRFESRTFGRLGKDSPVWVESITADGKGYNFDANGVPFESNGFDLKVIARFAQGPCANYAAATPCRFAARTFYELAVPVQDGVAWLEWILVNGRIWVYDISGQQRDPNSFIPVTSPNGTAADQVNVLKSAFVNAGSIGRTLILPNERLSTFQCDVQETIQSSPTVPNKQYKQLLVFNDTGGYSTTSSVENSSGSYRFNLENAQITFLSGSWVSTPGYDVSNENDNGPLRGRLDSSNNRLDLTAQYGSLAQGASFKTAVCGRVANGTPPPSGGTGSNPLILDGQTSSTYGCTIDVRVSNILTIQQSVGDTTLNRDGTYFSSPTSGQYTVDAAAGAIEFLSGFWFHPAGNDRFGSFSPQDPTRFRAWWYGTPGSNLRELATCKRKSETKGGLDPARPQSTFTLTSEARACVNYPDANQCEANRLFVFLFGREGEPAGVTYWAGVNLSAAEKRSVFIEIYRGSTTALVTSLYQACLLREPDPDGLTAWRNYLEANGVNATARIFAASDEAISKGSPCTVNVE